MILPVLFCIFIFTCFTDCLHFAFMSFPVILSIQVYGRGSGADCRRHVQNLNSLRQEADKIQTLSVCHYDNPELENKEQGLTTVPEVSAILISYKLHKASYQSKTLLTCQQFIRMVQNTNKMKHLVCLSRSPSQLLSTYVNTVTEPKQTPYLH